MHEITINQQPVSHPPVSHSRRAMINSLLTVHAIYPLSENMLRVIFKSQKPLIIDPLWIGPHLKLLFPVLGSSAGSSADGSRDACPEIIFPHMDEDNKIIWQPGMRERIRTYSVRNYDASLQLLTIDFVIHKQGIATVWAQQANIGDQIGLVNMGAKDRFDDKLLVLLGDISALPAISYILTKLPATVTAIPVVEIRHATDKNACDPALGNIIQWSINQDNNSSRLMTLVTELSLPHESQNILFWGGMESSLAQKMRHYLKDRFSDCSADTINLISYWREGFAEGEFKHRE